MESYLEDLSSGVAFVGKSDLMRPAWDLPNVQAPGFTRAMCRGIRGDGASLGVVVMPYGQRSPVHSYSGEHLLLGISGEVRFDIGDAEYVLGELDLLFIGADVDYRYRNVGLEPAVFADVIGRVTDWPPHGTYADAGGSI